MYRCTSQYLNYALALLWEWLVEDGRILSVQIFAFDIMGQTYIFILRDCPPPPWIWGKLLFYHMDSGYQGNVEVSSFSCSCSQDYSLFGQLLPLQGLQIILWAKFAFFKSKSPQTFSNWEVKRCKLRVLPYLPSYSLTVCQKKNTDSRIFAKIGFCTINWHDILPFFFDFWK